VKYNSELVARFANRVMRDGKKSTAYRIMYDAFDIIEDRTKKPPLDVFDQAVRNVTPLLEVRPRRVGGATYQIPMEVRHERRLSLAIRWLLQSARQRPGKSMAEKLASELMDAAGGQGASIKKKDDTHRMAEANRAFAHYRW
jgi:small subunit ribosomal protein S7